MFNLSQLLFFFFFFAVILKTILDLDVFAYILVVFRKFISLLAICRLWYDGLWVSECSFQVCALCSFIFIIIIYYMNLLGVSTIYIFFFTVFDFLNFFFFLDRWIRIYIYLWVSVFLFLYIQIALFYSWILFLFHLHHNSWLLRLLFNYVRFNILFFAEIRSGNSDAQLRLYIYLFFLFNFLALAT